MSIRTRPLRTCVAIAAALVLAALIPDRRVAAVPTSCSALSTLAVPHVTVTLAQARGAGPFIRPGAGDNTASGSLPAFCRVAATLTPTPDSEIRMELWMPASGWNGKYLAVGNGAFSGSIAYPAMMTALAGGYATSSTDTGHTGNTASFASGHPEKVIDFGWRAVHEMTVASKVMLGAFYATAPKFSYWNGCSAGGRQALKEAQRFPADFDGIVAGAPGLDWTGRAAQATRVVKALEKNESARLSGVQTQTLHKAVVDACDAQDGVKDGLIADPAKCTVDPSALPLSPAQIETVRLIYSPVVNSKTKREIGGLAPGSELGWTNLGWTASARATGLDQFRFLVFKDPGWDAQRFDPETDIARAEDADGGTINALDPDLRPFIDRGGKLIQYHGWSDPQISPFNSTQYYERVRELLADDARLRSAYRLFMAPGMGHCSGGEGPSTFDAIGALERWVEQGKAPDQIVAAHATNGTADRTRPLCPYPQTAVYSGTGSIDEAASFRCR